MKETAEKRVYRQSHQSSFMSCHNSVGKAIFLLVFVDGPDSKSALGTAPAEAEIGTKLPPIPVADAHDLLEIGFVLFFLGLNKDQSFKLSVHQLLPPTSRMYLRG